MADRRVRGRVLRALVPAAALVLVLASGQARVGHAQGLKLDKATEKETDGLDRPNPHFELECTECHGEKPPAGSTWATVKFVNGEEGNVKLCYNCHDASDNIHPIDIDPAAGSRNRAAALDFHIRCTMVCFSFSSGIAFRPLPPTHHSNGLGRGVKED